MFRNSIIVDSSIGDCCYSNGLVGMCETYNYFNDPESLHTPRFSFLKTSDNIHMKEWLDIKMN